MNFKNFKKGQALPLNTIVIAILVIIVLLVIIVFFTTQVGETGEQLSENSASTCSLQNPALITLYDSIQPIGEDETCESAGWVDHKQAGIVPNCCVKKLK